MNMKQVIVMRKDLGMRKGKMCAQAAHASVKSVLGYEFNKRVGTWAEQGMPKIVVGCQSEDELFQIYQKAKEADLPVELICDAGKTEFKEPTYTCCSIGPADKDDIDYITGGLKLL